MNKKIGLTFLTLLFICSTSFAARFQVDSAHTQIHFSVQHLVVFKVRGNFTDFTGIIEANPDNRTLISAAATIQTASIDTRIEKRDQHLRSADFFDASNHPQLHFKSKSITGSGDNIIVLGEITIKGVTKEIMLQGSFLGTTAGPDGKLRAGFEATGMLNRKDFGLNWNKLTETGSVIVGDEIQIGLEIEAMIKPESMMSTSG
ncbi:Polyisoprenoid-binding protein YceI [Desulfuromusa kysingii]|uniref:Polyisoprenoid-binding protein YceI n=1 Tax=Desulfuromusa kysingii TaxID=37625 RepID=A0A1H3W3L4_9BACT|nr:YceI family protein [Desulfuromusa kysingii]SDZ81014.1 Polyisoprenoid-binding protein YceI [Desulfuromusa kysingii]